MSQAVTVLCGKPLRYNISLLSYNGNLYYSLCWFLVLLWIVLFQRKRLTHNLKSNCNNLHCLWKNFTFLTFPQELYIVVIIMWVGKIANMFQFPSSCGLADLNSCAFKKEEIRVNIVVVCAFVNSSKTTIFTSSFSTLLIIYACYSTHTHKKNYKIVINYYISSPSESSVAPFWYITPTFHDPFNSRRIIQFCTKLYPLKCLTF